MAMLVKDGAEKQCLKYELGILYRINLRGGSLLISSFICRFVHYATFTYHFQQKTFLYQDIFLGI